jgi:hypothetical protein
MYACIHEVEGGHIEALAWLLPQFLLNLTRNPRILNSLENQTNPT